MKRNIELKARVADLAAAHGVARSLTAQLHAVERQRDTYFCVAQGRLKLRERWSFGSTGVLDQGCPSQLIWYRRPDDAQVRASDYSLIVLENGAEMRDLLARSLGVRVEVEKVRTVYLYDNVRIHLDEVARLGAFLEFEAIVDSTCDEPAAREKLDKLIAVFQSVLGAVIDGSYSDLLRC
jgi:adenylate cyclase class IV